MAASFPDSIKTWSTEVDDTDTIDAEYMNDLYAEIIAIETYLLGA